MKKKIKRSKVKSICPNCSYANGKDNYTDGDADETFIIGIWKCKKCKSDCIDYSEVTFKGSYLLKDFNKNK